MASVAPQAARAVLMVRPARFAHNPQTSASNHFQQRADPPADLVERARQEFDALAEALGAGGIEVQVFEGAAHGNLPDELFPNNWLSTHADGTVALYPMLAPNRRAERRQDIVDWLLGAAGRFERVVDLSALERSRAFLEGTGSLVLDRANGVAYACLSERTTLEGLAAFAERIGYETITFDAADGHDRRIFHTNMLMAIGTDFAIFCAESIREPAQRSLVLDRLAASGRDIVAIGREQMHAFAGNVLELRSAQGPVIAMSRTAIAALEPAQRRRLEGYGTVCCADIRTIERFGGGGVRCMLAEIHRPANR